MNLLYCDLVPGLPDRLLYLDYDVICLADCTESYHQDLKGVEYVAVPDYYGKRVYGGHMDSYHMKKVYRYRDFDEDLTTNSGQETVLPGDWRIIREKPLERLWSSFLYGLFAIVSWCYLRFGLHARFEGRILL